MSDCLRAPFPYFGAKSRIAPLVWSRFGEVQNFAEPFFGSGAVLLGRPGGPDFGVETVNDYDGLLANFWRATQRDPAQVARWADWPVSEPDLHARHAWLLGRKPDLTARLCGDPDFYDAKAAGWWVWGICQWIGGGWCSGNGPWHSVDGVLVKQGEGGAKRQLPHLGDAGMGINRQLPHLGAGRGIHRQRPHLGDAGMGQCELWSEHLQSMMRELADRLRRVRVCCGDWTRVCGPTPTKHCGTPAAIFLDPPYSHAERDSHCYAEDHDVAQDVLAWCVANGDDPDLRIALCGYEDEHDALEALGWDCVPWKAHGGYGSQGHARGRDNATRERVWFSPHCLTTARPLQLDLFGGDDA
jgi:hypothetical protein